MIPDTDAMDRPVERQPGAKRWLLGSAIAVALALLVFAVQPMAGRWLASDRSVARAQLRFGVVNRGDLVHSVAVQGRVVAASRPTLFSPADGIVSVKVNEGQQVDFGEVLVSVESPELKSLLRQEIATREALESALLRLELERRQRDLENEQAVEQEDEFGRLAAVYNDIGAVLGQERKDIRQRELVLASVLEVSPTAVLLVNPVGRLLVANQAARRLLAEGRAIEGHSLEEVLANCPEGLRTALGGAAEGLVGVIVGGSEESYQITRQPFELNTRKYLLLQIRNVTPQLRRQEVAIWKKVIRVVGHEINNALTPIRSLVGTGRRLVDRGDLSGRLPEVLEAIDDSAARLHRFVDSYRTVARLPAPRPEDVDLRRFLEHLEQLEDFVLASSIPAVTASFDPAQLQQVILNLVRNAREAGSTETEVRAWEKDGDLVLEVADRGPGMDEQVMVQAVLPFWSTKESGSGVGLALCREILEAHGGDLRLMPRQGGGLVVSLRLPGALGTLV